MTHRWNHRRDRNFDVFRVIRHKLMIMMAIGPMILLKPQSWDSQVWKSHNFDVIWSIGLRVIKSVPNLSQRCLSFSHFTGLHLISGLYNCLIKKTKKVAKTASSIEVELLAWVSFLFSRRYKGPDPWTRLTQVSLSFPPSPFVVLIDHQLIGFRGILVLSMYLVSLL